jgi:O-antigen ligase
MAPEVRYQRLLGFALGLWAMGVEVHEVIATVAAWSTFTLVLWKAPRFDWSRWWPLAAMLAWALVVPALWGRAPTMTGLARLSDWLLLPAAAMAVTKVSDRSLPRIGLVAGAVLLVSCSVAASQFFGLWPRSASLAWLSWARLPFARMDETVPGRVDRFMAGGLLLHRLKFANVGAVFTVLAVCASVRAPPYRRVFLGIAIIAIPCVLIFPHARAAAVALMAGMILALVLGSKDRRIALVAVATLVVIAGLIMLAVPSVRERFAAGFSSEGVNEREIITASGLSAIARHPLTGEGIGRFKPSLYAPADAPTAVLEHQGKAHNQFVSLAAEAGLPAAIFMIALLLRLGMTAWHARPTGVPLLATLTVFVMLCALHDPLFHVESSMACMLGLGATLGLIDRQQLARSSIAGARTS